MKISIVMPVKNEASTLTRCLQSLARQTFGDFEVIATDDGSTDGSGEILDDWAARDARFQVFRASQSASGITANLIAGCKTARGEWIARQDADDWSEPDRLARLWQFAMERPECVAVGSWVRRIAPGGEVFAEVRRPEDPRLATAWLLERGKGPPAHGAMMFRTAAYHAAGGYRREFTFAQDCDLWFRLQEHGLFGYVPDFLYNHVASLAAISSKQAAAQARFGRLAFACFAAKNKPGGQPSAPLAQAAALSKKIEEQARCRARKWTWPDRHGSSTLYQVGAALALRGHPACRRYFVKAFLHNPLHMIALARWALHALRP